MTLADLDEENISKPQPRTVKGDTEGNRTNKIADEQFTYPVNSWSRDIIDGFKRHEKEIIITPSSSEYFYHEEKIQAEQEDAPVMEEISRTSRTARSDTERTPQAVKTDVRERRKRSPSPKKIIRSSSLKRSPSKASDQGEQKLITNKNEEAYEERNTFSNPVMENEWSNFLGNETDTDAAINPMANLKPPNEPVIQIIDRGRDALGSSPYQGDRIQLISTTDSTSQASGISAHLGSPGLSSWSAESTPDHSTHLLKGMQVIVLLFFIFFLSSGISVSVHLMLFLLKSQPIASALCKQHPFFFIVFLFLLLLSSPFLTIWFHGPSL